MSRYPLVLCADDFGLTPAVSAGILQALEAGRLNATGAMTNRPDWQASGRRLAGPPGEPMVGVHLNLTLGAPLGPAPALAPEGVFPGKWAYLRPDPARRREIAAEIARQFDAFQDVMGRAPDFVDGHQHVHMLWGVRDLLLQEAGRRGWAGKVWLRDSTDRPGRIVARRVETTKALALAALGRGFGREAAARGFATNEGFSGVSAFDPRRDFSGDFARYLRAPGARHLVMCHPGFVDAELAGLDPVTATREQELAFLLSDAFSERMERAGAFLSGERLRSFTGA